MKESRQWVLVISVLGALAVTLVLLVTQLGPGLLPLRIGDRAPEFSAVTLEGSSVPKGVADYEGEVVLLNIWATWCLPCRVEMPSMQQLHDSLASKGLKIVAVSIDVGGTEDRIREFARELGLTFEILHDAPGLIQRAYQTTGVPETFVIGRDGRLRRRIIGAENWASPANVAFIERLLAEPVP